MVPPLFAIFTFPLVVIFCFARQKPILAMGTSIIAGYLFLPHGRGLDLPALPPIDKDFVPAVAALMAMLIVLGRMKTPDPRFLPTWLPKNRQVLIFLLMLMAGFVGTTLTNGDSLRYGPLVLNGMRLYDSASLLVHATIMLLPFLLARRFMGHPDAHVMLLWLLVATGAVYSFLSLYETRMSPQLNTNLYGYFQHRWNQHIRADGFRPIVFLQHGLWVSLFFSTVALSALTLFRAKSAPTRSRYLFLAVWVLMTLVLTKSLGALVITVALAPAILFLKPQTQTLIACSLAVTVMLYPVLRSAELVPVNRITSLAASIDYARALSFETRLRNEDLLLERAQQRPVFGWGTYGRNRIYDERGNTSIVTDGYWIIVISTNGWVGYIGIFGLLSSGIISLTLARRKLDLTPATAGLCVILAGNMIDLIPNATLTPVTWLIAGALLGRFEHGHISEGARGVPEAHTSRHVQYSRFGPQQATPDQATVPEDSSAPVQAQNARPAGRLSSNSEFGGLNRPSPVKR